VLDDPARTAYGDYEVIVSRPVRGAREAAAVVIIVTRGTQLIVKTVMWLDGR